MKQILFLRHAKSSWSDSLLDDVDRPLAKRGRKDAPLIGSWLKKIDYLPNAVITSPATRARQTTDLVIQAAGLSLDLVSRNEKLYYGAAEDYLNCICQNKNKGDILLLVGHNPKIEQVISLLCSSPDHFIARMPTAGLVCLEHPAVEWKQVTEGTARIAWMLKPKLLRKVLF